MSKHEDFCEEVAKTFIEMLEAGTAPWQKEWDAGVVGTLHHNPKTDAEYKGINQFYLDIVAWKKGYDDPRWMTYKQAKEAGYQVKKGEKHNKVEYWKWPTKEEREEITAKGVRTEKDLWRLNPRPFFARVFNGEQIEGLEPYVAPEIDSDFSPIPQAEAIIEGTGMSIYHRGSTACYSPMEDKIKMPPKEAFEDEAGYYVTVLHEIGHATGHQSRLARDFGARGTQGYAKEELRAEISSYMVAKKTGLPHNPQNQASYVESWIKNLKEHPREIFRACHDANLIQQWILEPDKRQELEQRCQSKAQSKTKTKTQKVEVVAMSKPTSHISPKVSPEDSLRDAMQKMGLVPGEIVIDGEWHRVPVSDDNKGKKSGSYKAYSDGVPNGTIVNHKTGETLKWLHKDHGLSKEELTTLRKEAEVRKKERDKEQNEKWNATAKQAYGIWTNAPIASDHPYLKAKGVEDRKGLLRLSDKDSLIVPMMTKDGWIQSLQFINKDGSKRYLKDAKTEGGLLKLPSAKGNFAQKPIVIAEGYATTQSIQDATCLPCVVAFSAGNMLHVAKIIKEQWPKKEIILAADNDKVGLEKAQEAAQAVNGKVVVPSFTKGEKERGLTDFNDLASSRGKEAVRDQFANVLGLKKTKTKEPAMEM